MIDSKEAREKAFREEFASICRKWNCEFSIDDSNPYKTPFIEVFIPSIYDADGNTVEESVFFRIV